MGSHLYEKKKRLKALNQATSMNIDEMIHLASRKLYPIIEMIVDNSNKSEHFLTVQEFDDATVAANFIKEICKVLGGADFKIGTKNIDFSLNRHIGPPNDQNKIYIETGLLLQLIDLYNVLEDAKDTIDEFYRSIGIHSFMQTDSRVSVCSEESSANANKIVLRLTKPIVKSTSSFGFFSKNFIVLPSSTASTDELRGSRSSPFLENDNDGKESSAKRVKSTSSLISEHISEVTDVYGARKVVVRCIYDLQEVSKYLDTERKDVATICSRVEVDEVPVSSARKSNANANEKNEKAKSLKNDKSEGDCCCCPECLEAFESKADLQECDDDKVIICIKGCNEDEGDVQIVIRQCPECKKIEGPRSSRPDTSASRDVQQKEKEPQIDESRPAKVESLFLHNKDSQGSYVCSEEEDEEEQEQTGFLALTKSPISKAPIFVDDGEPESKSSATLPRKPPNRKPSNVQQQSRAECSKIRMFETTNLCLETDTGQELVISVTITPKEFDNKKLSLRDIFSEDDYENQTQKRNSIASLSKKSVSLHEPSEHSSFPMEDKIIPLGRTKICSSIDFNVTTLQTRIRDKGIQHRDAKIVVQLQELGIDNLLRACRPAKCCRRAVLNEKMKKCLPYPPSLRSLPLDDEDMEVINQSLQMSLQKVKNSTNLKKDYYANYTYSIKPIQTIMYFFVSHSLNSISKNDAVRQKLRYYINLVNDVEFETISTFDILYFGVKETSNLSQEIRKNSDQVNKNIQNKDSMRGKKDVASLIPFQLGKQKHSQYEKRSMLTGYTNMSQNSSFLVNQNSKIEIKNQCKIEHDSALMHAKPKISIMSKVKSKNNANVSKIPIYIGNNSAKCSYRGDSSYREYKHNIEEIEQEIDGLSLDSLCRDPDLLKQSNLFSGLESKTSLSSKNKPSDKEKLNRKNRSQKIEQKLCPLNSTGTSKYSLFNNFVVRKVKKKKKTFYMSKSKSDVSLLKNKLKHKATCTQTKYVSKEILNKKSNSAENKFHIRSLSNIVKEQSSSKIILFFSKMLYKMIMREALNDKAMECIMPHKNYQDMCTETTESNSLCELYSRLSGGNNNPPINKLGITCFNVESTHHDLKAKQSESCMLITSNANKKNVCIIDLAIQTSVLFGIDNKHCQTSNSLLTYWIHPKTKPENTYLQKKRIFKRVYNSEALSGIQNSCDQLEKFIVLFGSDHSLKSNISDNLDSLSAASDRTECSLENVSGQTIDQSLLKLKETLEKYENVKSEIAQGSMQASNVNPIEYFVYQTCACNKINKKPSVLQKLLSKSKGFLTSLEKDISTKYKNQRGFFSMSTTDRQRLCQQCGCYISKCTGIIPPAHSNGNNSSNVCACPPENKSDKLASQSCCKSPKSSNTKKGNYNTSKIPNASKSSVQSLKTYLKKSMSHIKSQSKEKKLGPCFCAKEMMISKNTETIGDEKRSKKDTSTGTTKDSTTQKCECVKCQNFSEDGSCCCSHCLGCLDKSCDTKPNNNNVGTLCDSLDELALKDSSNGTGEILGNKPMDTGDETINSNKKKNSEDAVGSSEDITAPDSPENVPSKEILNPASAQSSNSAEIATLESFDVESEDRTLDSETFYFLTSSPKLVNNQFGLRSRNPFEPHLLNFPKNVNMFRIDTSK